MQENIIARLFSSFSDLEEAIESAKTALAKKKAVPKKLVDRLDSYDGILAKQKLLAGDLCRYINNGDWDEVARHVSLINGLSAMIRDDAHAILSALSQPGMNETVDEDDVTLC